MNVRITNPIQYKVENSKYISVKTPFGNHISNMSGKIILDCLCDGASLESIVEKYQKEKGGAYHDSAVEVWEFLSSLKTLGFVEFDEKYFENLVLRNKFNIAGEREYQKISDSIIQKLNTKTTIFSIYSDEKNFNQYILRNKGFGHKELYFFSETQGGICSVMGITNLSEKNVPANIVLIQSDDEEDLYELFEFIQKELKRLKKHKIRAIFPINSDERLTAFLKKFDFFKEGELIKEDNEKDFYVYSKLILN